MIHNFIAGLVAIFYWGKTSSKTLEKILKASMTRTIIYGILSVVVAVFLYKTYQVATVYNMIQITGAKQARDSSGHVLDSVRNMSIVHKLSENSMLQGDIHNMGIRKYSTNLDYDKILNEYGGAFFCVFAKTHPYKYQDNKVAGYDEEAQLELQMQLAQKNIPYQEVNHLYQLSYLATNIPSIIPFYPEVEMRKDFSKEDSCIFYSNSISNSRNSPLFNIVDEYTKNNEIQTQANNGDNPVKLPEILNNGFYFVQTVGTYGIDKTGCEYAALSFIAHSDYTNKLNIFTAADISQYTYLLTINSDCPIEEIFIDYDIPIETTPFNEHMSVGTRGFHLDSVLVKKLLEAPSMGFHIKIPSLANLQLIRSLVLTTLVTALFSLFCKNLYYSIRRWAYNRRKKNWIPYKVARQFSARNKEQIRHGQLVFIRIMYFLLICLIIFILAVTFIVTNNTSILLPIGLYDYLFLLPILLLLISAIFIHFGYNKVRKPLLKALSGEEDTTQEESDGNITTIFIHERNDDEEYDKLVEEQLKESGEEYSTPYTDGEESPEGVNTDNSK